MALTTHILHAPLENAPSCARDPRRIEINSPLYVYHPSSCLTSSPSANNPSSIRFAYIIDDNTDPPPPIVFEPRKLEKERRLSRVDY